MKATPNPYETPSEQLSRNQLLWWTQTVALLIFGVCCLALVIFVLVAVVFPVISGIIARANRT
jgi:hypothetical protein